MLSEFSGVIDHEYIKYRIRAYPMVVTIDQPNLALPGGDYLHC